MSGHTFTLPRQFQAELPDMLPTRLLTRADDARWLMHTVLRKTASRNVDAWGCARLHSDILRRVMYSHTQPAIVKVLEDAGAIETAPHRAGVTSIGFRLGRRFLGDRAITVRATDTRLIERIQTEQQRQQADDRRTRWKPIHCTLDELQRRLTITPDANIILESLPAHTRLCQDVLVGRLWRREFGLSVSKTGRLFNAISGLKQELRTALRIDDSPVGSVDIVNAQPCLLALLLEQEFPTNGPKKRSMYKHTCGDTPAPAPSSACALSLCETRNFGELATSGLLYERLMAATGLDRPTVKLRFLVDVLAKRGSYPSRVEQVFRDAFPGVYRIIRTINRRDHGELIRRLQTMESQLVVETVAPRLVERIPIVTLHDQIYSRRPDVPTVVDAFDTVFDELDFRMTLKCEDN